MSKRKIYVVGNVQAYSKWIKNHELTDNLEEADIVLFTGGEDVDPSLYDCERHPSTYSNIKRDLEEKAIFEKVKPNQVCLGICRGSQFLCVMNGGLLIQNVTCHAIFGTHTIVNAVGDKYEITSTHHQMQYPFNLQRNVDYTILYKSIPRSTVFEGDKIDFPRCEPEIVLYHKQGMPKCIAIQGHPEIMRTEAPVIKMLNDLIDYYVR